MTDLLRRLLTESTRLTRSGKLREATAAIQSALRGLGKAAPTAPESPAPARNDEGDVSARVAPAAAPSPASSAAHAHSPAHTPAPSGPPLPMPAPARRGEPAAARATPAGDEFIAGNHAETAGQRDYKLYVPPGAGLRHAAGDSHVQDAAQPLHPLIVMLHGCTQDPDDFALGTGMNRLARERGCFVLYPAQSRLANPGRCWNWFKPNHQQRGRGEPALLAGMTRAVLAHYPIDPQRVYVAGLSAGGAMAAILGDAYPELYAAVGVHSGLRTGAASDMGSAFSAMSGGAAPAAPSAGDARPTPPTIVFHGDADSTVHPANGEQAVAASAGRAEPRTEEGRGPGRAYTRRSYRDAQGRVCAEHWAVHGAGHAWSGGHAPGSFTDAQGPDASAEMLRFFLAHPLAAAS